MIDLPVLLDDPVARPGGESAVRSIAGTRSGRSGTSAARRSAMTGIPWPWWMAPARIVGRLQPSILAASAADAIELRRLPRVAILLAPPILVFLLSAVVSISHASTILPHPTQHVDWLRLTTDTIYTESALFLLFVVAIGTVSPGLGALLVVVFGVMDIVAATASPYELRPFPRALVGRLIAIWLLWLLAVEIPILGRQLGLSWRRLAGNRFAVAVLTGLATGAFIWAWTQATTVLIRPVFTWSTLPSGVTVEAVRPVQTAGLVFAVVGGLVAALGALVRGPAGLLRESSARPTEPTPGAVVVVRRLLRRVVGAALLTVGLGGLISWPLEAVVLFAVILGAGPLARFVADRTPLGAIVLALPPIARYAIAAALAFGAAQVTIAPLYRFAAVDSSGRFPEFFSVVAAVAIGYILIALVTTPGTRRASAMTAASSAAVVLLILGTLLLVVLAAPVAVLADNCGGIQDCWGAPFLAGLAGGGLPMTMAAASWSQTKRWLGGAKYEVKTERAVAGVRG